MSTTLRFGALLTCLFSMLLMASPSSATVLDLASVNSHLKRAESNLTLVDGSIGHLTSPPKGSAAKLAKLRLGQAFDDIDAARVQLEGLSGEGVAEATTRYNAATELYNKLRAILNGETPKPDPEPAPEPEPGPDPTPKTDAPKTVKLGYPHADNFKSALFTLRRVEADTASIVNVLEAVRPVKDQLSINHRTTVNAMAKIVETRRQAGFAEVALGKIPSNGEGVAEAKQRLVNARASIDTAEAFIKPLNAKLLDLINPANYPSFYEDVKRLRELASTYGNPEMVFREQRGNAAEALLQGEAAKAECIRIAKAYARLMEQETEQGKQVEVAGNNFLSAYAAFLAEAKLQQANLPAEIRKDLAECDRMANEAVQSQKPMWFNGGIPQHMGWAVDKLALLTVLDPQGAKPLQVELDAMKTSLRSRADSLKELIIRENRMPNDAYTGEDRDAVIAFAVETWKAQEKDFELLAVRIPSEAWTRETKWTYSNGTWYFVDKSKLQVRLIVADQSNPELAIDRPINIRKDHQSNDKLIGFPFRSFEEPLEPSEYFLRSNIQ